VNERELDELESARQEGYKPLIENEIDEFLSTYDELRRSSSPWIHMDSIFTIIHDPLPEIPNFGIFYLNVVEASALIAADFTQQSEALDADYFGQDALKAEKTLHEARKKVTRKFITRIMHAIEQGMLVPVYKNVNPKNFVEGTDDPLFPTQTYIHFPELLNWLCHNGFAKISDMEDLRYMWNYCCAEYGLALELDGYIKMRRSFLKDSALSDNLPEEHIPLAIGYDLPPEYLLGEAMRRVDHLEKQLHQATRSKAHPAEKPLDTRERETAATVLQAVCKLGGINLDSRQIGSQIQRVTEELGVPLAPNTISKWIDESLEAFKGKEKKCKNKYAKTIRIK
jgi:hypothetical protein